MAINYKDWLTRTGRKGTEADALQWKKTHGVALGLYNPDGTPKVASAPAAAAPSATQAAPAVNLADPRLPGLDAQMQSVPGTFNDQRRQTADQVLRNLISTGYLESGSLGEESADSGIVGAYGQNQKNITYKIIAGPNGKLYRQAYETTRDSQNQRGFLESSQTNQVIHDRRRDLDTKVNSTLADLSDSMTSSLGSERDALSGIDSQRRSVLSEVAQQQADDPAALAAATPNPTAAPAAATAGRTGTPISKQRFITWRKNMGRSTLIGTALDKAYNDYVASFKQ